MQGSRATPMMAKRLPLSAVVEGRRRAPGSFRGTRARCRGRRRSGRLPPAPRRRAARSIRLPLEPARNDRRETMGTPDKGERCHSYRGFVTPRQGRARPFRCSRREWRRPPPPSHPASPGLAAEIGRVEALVRGDPLDRASSGGRPRVLAEMFEHHHRRPEGADQIGDAFAHDVEGRAVNRLEHRREACARD